MKVDINSDTWATVKARAEAELASALTKLEQPLDPAETNIERGKIIALRTILKLAEPTPDPKRFAGMSGAVPI